MLNSENSILDTLHSQFAENQNHHQSLFIQFLIALFALFIGFGYIYTHSVFEGDSPYNVDYTQSFVQNIDEIKFFSYQILLATSVIVSTILLLLNCIIVHQGYGFRRDQYLNKIIREESLGKKKYNEIFGELYNPNDKFFFNYLPNFYTTFFWFVLAFQFFVFIAICLKENLVDFTSGNGASLVLFVLNLILIFMSFCVYYSTYCKYMKNIEKK